MNVSTLLCRLQCKMSDMSMLFNRRQIAEALKEQSHCSVSQTTFVFTIVHKL